MTAALQTPQTIDYRPGDPAQLADPFPLFRRMRDEDPVHWSPRLRAWILTRHEDVKAASADVQQLSSDRLRPFFAAMPSQERSRIADIIRYLSEWMVFKDPPDHTRLRRLVSKVLNARSMAAMRPSTESITDWLLRRLDGRDSFDFIADFAGPLPALVVMEMLGVAREDLALMKELSDRMALFIGSSRISAEKYDIAEQATHEMAEYFKRLIELRRREPGTDAISLLAALGADAQDPAERLTQEELVGTCILMLFGGHETTTNHLANGLLSLMRFPDEMRKLRQRPELAPRAVEELLRFDGPSGAQARVVARSHTMRDKSLKEGDRVFLMLNAANRDERVWRDPDRLDIEREGVAHLTFGYGAHICLGFPLARLEGQVAFAKVLERFRHIEPATASQTWINSLVFRGMTALPVRVSR